jgi:CHAT domain-containing protein/tetratricopeptide (TPR) repeat protein
MADEPPDGPHHDRPDLQGLLEQGRELLNRWQLDAALAILHRVLKGYEREPDRALECAQCHLLIGWACQRASRLPDAIAHLDEARRRFAALPATEPERTRCLVLLGSSYAQLARHQAALHSLDEALALLASLPDMAWERAACHTLRGTVYQETNRLDSALQEHRAALASFSSLPGSEADQANCFCYIAFCLRSMGRLQEALEQPEAALRRLRDLPHSEFRQAACYQVQSEILWDLGRFEACLEALDRALALYRMTEGSERYQARAHHTVARALMVLGRCDEAIRKCTQALTLLEGITGTESEQAWARLTMGLNLIFLRQPGEALDPVQQGLDLVRPIPGTERNQAALLHATGQALAMLGRFDEALAAVDEAERILSGVTAPCRQHAAGHRIAGETYLRAGRPADAAARYERAAALCDPTQDGEELWEICYGLGQAREALGDRPGAVTAYLDSIQHLEALRVEVLDRANRVAFFQEKTAVYLRLVALLLDGGERETGAAPADPRLARWGATPEAQALALSEAAKARALADLLREHAEPEAEPPAEWLAEERRLGEEVARRHDALHALGREPGAEGESLREQIRALELERDLLAVRIRRAARPPLAPARFLTLPQIQALLAPGEALLEYAILPGDGVARGTRHAARGKDSAPFPADTLAGYGAASREPRAASGGGATRLALWVVTRDGLSAHVTELPAGDSQASVSVMAKALRARKPLGLAERVRLYRYPMESRLRTAGKLGVREHQRVGRLLAEALLPQAAREELRAAGVRRLAIVPDGALHHVPFAALILQEDGDTGAPPRYEACRYLVHEFSVSVLPSATALAALRARSAARRAGGGRVPARQRGWRRRDLLAFADPVFSTADPRARPEGDSALLRAETDVRLPATADEARQVASLFPEERVAVYMGRDATKERLLAARPETFRFLLFATHAHVDEEHPMLSYVRLTASGEERGFLRAREIFALPLDADLVALSACESGLGRLDRGEGIVGLTTAFFSAGAQSVVATLWKIVDHPSAALTPRLYAHLKEGRLCRADALRQAQLEMIAAQPEFTHPFFWAFTLLGDGLA